MVQISRFWDGTTLGDATVAPYDAGTEFSEVMSAVSGAAGTPDKGGVIKAAAGELGISTPSAGTIRIGTGEAIVYGAWYKSDANVDHTFAAPASAPRTDVIILRKSWADQTVRQIVLVGTEGGGVPALQKTVGTTWDMPIANVAVATDGSMTVSDRRVFLGVPDVSVIWTDPIIRDTLYFGAKPAGSADASIHRVGANFLETPGWLQVTSGRFFSGAPVQWTGTHPGAQGAWDNGNVRIIEPGWEALNLFGNNSFGVNLNFFHKIGTEIWRGATVTSRLSDATPDAQRIQFQIMVAGTGDVDPVAAYICDSNTHYWATAGALKLIYDGVQLRPYDQNALSLGHPAYRWLNVYASYGVFYGNVETPQVQSPNTNLVLYAPGGASVVVNPSSTYFYPINGTVKLGHPSWSWNDVWCQHVSCTGQGIFDGGVRGNGSVFTISSAANIQLAPGGGIIHPDQDGTRHLGYTNLEWGIVYTRRVQSTPANPLVVSSQNGSVQIEAHGSGSPVNMTSDSGQMQVQCGDGFAFFNMRHNTMHLGTSAIRWIQGWGVQGWSSGSTREWKQNWSDLPEGQALAALRLMKFGRFEYKVPESVERNEQVPIEHKLSRWSVGYIAEDTVQVTGLVGGEDLFVSKTGRDVEPQRTASVVGAAVQDLDREIHEELALLRARIEQLEREKVYVNGIS